VLAFFEFAQAALPDMLAGTVVTIELTFGSIVLGFLLGLPLSILRTYGPKWLQPILMTYINLFRGTPLLVQLFVIYYGLPDLGITFDRMTAAYVTLALNSSAYQAEYFRGGFQAVGRGQMIAARAIGMTRKKAILHIVLPQALRLAVPAWTNEFISMVKYTAVVFLIAVPDLMNKAKMISSQQFAPIQSYLLAALIYLFLVGASSAIMSYANKKLAIPGLNLHPEGH